MNENKWLGDPNNYARVILKKSSSKDGLEGFDIEIQNTNATQEQMDNIAEIALKTALKVRQRL